MSEILKPRTDDTSKPSETFESQRLARWKSLWDLEVKDSEFFSDNFLQLINQIVEEDATNDKVNDILTWNQEAIEYSIDNLWENKYRISKGGDSIIVNHDAKYSVLRITPNLDYIGMPLNLSTDKKTLTIYRAKNLPSNLNRVLLTLKNMWIMRDDIPLLSIEKIEEQFQDANAVEWFIDEINHKEEPQSRFEDANKLFPENTHTVFTDDTLILNNPKEWEGIYTFWAWPCSILIIEDKDTWKIGLAHLSDTDVKESITSFFSYFSNPDITLVSWKLWSARTIIEAMWDELRGNISYFNLDKNWIRTDSMWIKIEDWKTKILYWRNEKVISNVNPLEMQAHDLSQKWSHWKFPINIK